MRALDQLREEHQAVLQSLKALDKISQKLIAGQKIEPQHLEQLLDFFQGFVDHCHHQKEESILFPEMERHGVPKENGPIGMMLFEHEQGRSAIRSLKVAIEKYQSNDPTTISEIRESSQKYAQVLEAHIDKENNVLFPIAENIIPPDEEEKISERFKEVEGEVTGEGKHEEYHRILDKLVNIYLI